MYVVLNSNKSVVSSGHFSLHEDARHWASQNMPRAEVYIAKLEIVLHAEAPVHQWTLVDKKD